MENDLLKKEKQFHTLNAELEIKTKELLKEVEGVMKIQDRFAASGSARSESSKSSSASHNKDTGQKPTSCARTSQNTGKSCSARTELPRLSTPTDGICSVYVPVAGGIGDDILPETSYGMGTDGLVRFLKAKVKGLQSDVDGMQSDYKKQLEAWRRLQLEMKTVEEDRDRWQQQAGALKELLKKQELQANGTATKLTQQQTENCSLKKELDILRKELRQALQTSKANEVRLNRSLEELEKMRTALHQYERDDKELRDLTRRKGEEVTTVVKRLERQKSELLHGFKKQMELIDNLKKQKAHLKAACMMQFTEEEFLKLLDWSPSNRCQ